MFRNTVLYRRLWYVRRRNARKVHIIFKLAAVFMIMWVILSYTSSRLVPQVAELYEQRAENRVAAAVSEAVTEIFSGDITYEDLVTVKRDPDGDISSIETDMAKLNLLSEEMSEYVREGLESEKGEYIAVPIGAITGIDLLSGTGPDILVNVKSEGEIFSGFDSEFHSQGINQTRHSIYLNINTKLSLTAPLIHREVELSKRIPVLEAVIVGKVPESYYIK